MLFKHCIRENSGGIEISKNIIRFRRVARNLQWEAVWELVGRAQCAREKKFFLQNLRNFRHILIKIILLKCGIKIAVQAHD